MERKIGEIFEYDGEWYQCIESDMCEECSLTHTMCGCGAKSNIAFEIFGICSKARRADNKHAIFKKLEKVGEPCRTHGHIVQRYCGVIMPIVLPKETFAIFDNEICNTVSIEVKRGEEDMEANEKTMPKTWEQCLVLLKKVEYIGSYGKVKEAKISENFPTFSDSTKNDWRYTMPRGLGKPMLALCQLLVCRNAWWKQLGWKPDWMDNKTRKHCIHSDSWSTCDITQHSTYPRILAFPNAETAKDFLDTFKDLIEEAKELL